MADKPKKKPKPLRTFTSPRQLMPDVLRTFHHILNIHNRIYENKGPDQKVTPNQRITMAKMRLDAAKELIKYIVPALRAQANVHVDADEDIVNALMDKTGPQLHEEMKEIENKMGLKDGAMGEPVTQAANMVIDVESIKKVNAEPVAPNAEGALKKASKQKSRTSGSPRKSTGKLHEVTDAERAGRATREASDIQDSSEAESGTGGPETST